MTTQKSITAFVHGHPKGALAPSVEISPGQKFVPLPHDPDTERLLVYKLVHLGGDHFKAVAQSYDRYIPITSANIRQLCLGVSAKTLHRLIVAGFIKGGLISPYRSYIDLASYYAHVQACMDDPCFWDSAERRRRYNEARALVR